jgi:hypothetical protein
MAVLLLSMNLYAYKRLSGRIAFKELFMDLKWGVFLPVFVFTIVLVEPVFWEKMLLTIVLTTVIGIILFRDDWAQPWLIAQARRVTNKLVSYA